MEYQERNHKRIHRHSRQLTWVLDAAPPPIHVYAKASPWPKGIACRKCRWGIPAESDSACQQASVCMIQPENPFRSSWELAGISRSMSLSTSAQGWAHPQFLIPAILAFPPRYLQPHLPYHESFPPARKCSEVFPSQSTPEALPQNESTWPQQLVSNAPTKAVSEEAPEFKERAAASSLCVLPDLLVCSPELFGLTTISQGTLRRALPAAS